MQTYIHNIKHLNRKNKLAEYGKRHIRMKNEECLSVRKVVRYVSSETNPNMLAVNMGQTCSAI